MPDVLLRFNRVGHAYARQAPVFREVSFTVAAGTATAVLGPNGSGKTTLVRCAAGLSSVSAGTVERMHPAGFVPQAHGMTFAYRALDMVLMGRARQIALFRTPGLHDRSAAANALDRVGAGALRDRLFPTLSGGEQQLVLIARALVAESPLLVLDEPSTGLDLKNQVRVLTLLRELVRGGLGVLLSTHHPDHAAYLADSVILLHEHTARTGSAADLLTDENLSQLYGVSCSAVRYRDDASGTERQTIVANYGQPTPASG